jgi:hypothetical protein
MKKELKEIMSLSFPFCKNNNEQLASYFQKINSLAHDAEVYIERNGLNKENHWTNKHHKNYHQSGS